MNENEPYAGFFYLKNIIDIEMKRLGWSETQGRRYLLQKYGARSRYLITKEQLREFLRYLQSQISPCTGCGSIATETTQTWIPREFKRQKGIERSSGYLCLECWIVAFEVTPETANRLRAGESLHTCNCYECRRFNRCYCTKCVD